jgi:hypothetical protein
MGELLEIGGSLLLPSAARLATAPAELGEVELAGVKQAQAIVDRPLPTRASCLRRGRAHGSRVGSAWLVTARES